MVIAPNMELMESTSLVMARTVQNLHKLIETKCVPQQPHRNNGFNDELYHWYYTSTTN